MIDATGNPQTVLLLGGTSEIGLAIVKEYLARQPLRVPRTLTEAQVESLFGYTLFLDSPTTARLAGWRRRAQNAAATKAAYNFQRGEVRGQFLRGEGRRGGESFTAARGFHRLRQQATRAEAVGLAGQGAAAAGAGAIRGGGAHTRS